MVNERAKGELVIDWAGGPEVIKGFDQAAAVRDGVVDLVLVPPGYCEKIHPPSIAFQLWDQTPMEQREIGAYDLMVELYKKMNVYCLGTLDSASRFYIFSNVMIKDPKTDFKGLKFRTGPAPAQLLDALGCVGVSMGAGDQYTALQQGVVVGVVTPANNFFEFNLFEVGKYWVDIGFWNPIEPALVNLDKWNKIPSHLQKLMLDVAKEAEPLEYNYQMQNNDKYFQTFRDAGMQPITFSPEDTKWLKALAYQVRWDVAKEAMTPEDYEKTRKFAAQ